MRLLCAYNETARHTEVATCYIQRSQAYVPLSHLRFFTCFKPLAAIYRSSSSRSSCSICWESSSGVAARMHTSSSSSCCMSPAVLRPHMPQSAKAAREDSSSSVSQSSCSSSGHSTDGKLHFHVFSNWWGINIQLQLLQKSKVMQVSVNSRMRTTKPTTTARGRRYIE